MGDAKAAKWEAKNLRDIEVLRKADWVLRKLGISFSRTGDNYNHFQIHRDDGERISLWPTTGRWHSNFSASGHNGILGVVKRLGLKMPNIEEPVDNTILLAASDVMDEMGRGDLAKALRAHHELLSGLCFYRPKEKP